MVIYFLFTCPIPYNAVFSTGLITPLTNLPLFQAKKTLGLYSITNLIPRLPRPLVLMYNLSFPFNSLLICPKKLVAPSIAALHSWLRFHGPIHAYPCPFIICKKEVTNTTGDRRLKLGYHNLKKGTKTVSFLPSGKFHLLLLCSTTNTEITIN